MTEMRKNLMLNIIFRYVWYSSGLQGNITVYHSKLLATRINEALQSCIKLDLIIQWRKGCFYPLRYQVTLSLLIHWILAKLFFVFWRETKRCLSENKIFCLESHDLTKISNILFIYQAIVMIFRSIVKKKSKIACIWSIKSNGIFHTREKSK